MWDSLPDHILTHILIGLPIKTIITCACVCKTWNFYIQNPAFISNHLQHSSNNNQNHNHLLLFFPYPTGFVHWTYSYGKHVHELYWDNNEDLCQSSTFDFPFNSCIFRVVATCNGLVCITTKYTNNLFLWNPCIRKFVKLPTPNLNFQTHSFCKPFLGFGFDAKTNDYKVVIIVNDYKKKSSIPKVEVYSLATDQWNIVTALPPFTLCDSDGSDLLAFVNGAVHCVARKKTKKKSINFVSAFDLGDNAFSEIAMPPRVGENSAHLSISVYRNCLALIQGEHSIISILSLNLWMMKEYAVVSSWTKVLTFDNQGDYIPRVIGFKNSGEVLLAMKTGHFISEYFDTQKVKILQISGNHTIVDSYVESLVLLDKPNRAVTY